MPLCYNNSFPDLSRGDSALGSSDDSTSICGDQSDHEGESEPPERPTTSDQMDDSSLNERSVDKRSLLVAFVK